MKKFENMGFEAIVTGDKVKIEIPISGLVNGFKWHQSNMDDGVKIKRGMRNAFAEWFAERVISEEDQETDASYIANACDRFFDLIFEGYDDVDVVKVVGEDAE
jgi:hypothetical protein